MRTFLLLNAGVALAALVVALGLGLRSAGALALGALAGVLVLVHSTVLFAGLLGYLTPSGLAILVVTALAGAALVAAAGAEQRAGRPTPMPGARAPVTPDSLVAPAAALAASAVWAWPHVREATRLWVWDDYTYHMVYPALWLRDQVIGAVTPAQAFTMQAWYPLSASVVATWFMAPFSHARADALTWVSLTGLLYAGLVAASAVALGRRLGCRPGAWAVPVVLFATSQRTAVMASSFSDADLAQASCGFAALAFSIPRGETETARDVRVDAAYAALLSGLALGVKISAATAALVVLLAVALRARALGRGLSARMRAVGAVALIFAASWAATGGYWYLRNAIHTGNPVYPAAFLAWPGATFPETTLLEYARRYGAWRAVTDALEVYLNWPRAHAGLALIGLGSLAVWLAVRRSSLGRPQRYFAGTVLAVTASVLCLLPAAPFSAGNAMTFRSGFIHWDSMRYVAIVLLLGWTALGVLVNAGVGAGPWRTLAAGLIAAVGVLTSAAPRPILWLTGAALLGALLLARRPPFPDSSRRVRALAAGAAVVVATAVIVSWHGAKASASREAFYGEPLFGGAVAVLDGQPAGTRLAVFGDQWIYPAFGDRLQLVPLRLDGNGEVATAPVADAMEPGERTVDAADFRSRLAESGVGLVVIVRQPHPGRAASFPTQHAALEATADARLLHLDRAVAIWRLGAGGAGASRAASGR